MPSVAENRHRWSEYSWNGEGHEWSPGGVPAAGEMLWWRTLLPRIHQHLPAGRILEIGPGYGRWTQHLLALSNRLVAVDVTERCVEYCRRRFAAAPHFECWMNDGESLDMVADGSVDFVFSFDSLVHADAPVMRAYLSNLARVVAPGGTGFIHHSNLGAVAGRDGRMPRWLARRHWRGETMSARLFRQYCRDAGLACVSQELINWVGRSDHDEPDYAGSGLPMIDTLSTFVKPTSVAPFTRLYVNPQFGREWEQLLVLAALYGSADVHASEQRDPPPPPLIRARRVLTHEGVHGMARRLKRAGETRTRRAAARVRRYLDARAVHRSEPVRAALRQNRCPDCGGKLDAHKRCAVCHVEFHGLV